MTLMTDQVLTAIRAKTRGALALALVAAGISWAAGCSLIVVGQLDDKSATDGGHEALPAPDTLPGKPIKLEASLAPAAAYTDQVLRLRVLVFNFKLVPLDQPPRAGEGHYVVSFVGAGEQRTSLFEAASREHTFRLADFPWFVPPAPGSYALEVSLVASDGSPVAPETVARLPLVLCDARQPVAGCEPRLPSCSPQQGCDACAVLYPPGSCPGCVTHECEALGPCVRITWLDPVVVSGDTEVEIMLSVDRFVLLPPGSPVPAPGALAGHYRLLLEHADGVTVLAVGPDRVELGHELETVTVIPPGIRPLNDGLLLLHLLLVDREGLAIDPPTGVCWPLLLVP